MSTDRIEKTVVLRASQTRVWQALTRAEEFATWFGMALDGAFTPGARLTARRTNPQRNRETIEFAVERVEPERLLTYRWHPLEAEPGVDYTNEPTTLVEFHLAEVADGTQLTVIESGFNAIPLARRATAFSSHDQGWTDLLAKIADHVAA